MKKLLEQIALNSFHPKVPKSKIYKTLHAEGEIVLSFSCPHLPFEKQGFLEFLVAIYKQFKCTKIVCLGDEIDNHAISYHDHDPDGMSAGDELKLVRRKLQPWYQAFPEMLVCIGNHTALPFRKARTHGLSAEMFKNYRDMIEAPQGWYWEDSFEIDGVLYEHGIGASGTQAHRTRALNNMQSTVIGHLHASAGVDFLASNDKMIFGMVVGCGIDRKSYAMAYGKHMPRKPILGCGIVVDGKYPQFIPMELK